MEDPRPHFAPDVEDVVLASLDSVSMAALLEARCLVLPAGVSDLSSLCLKRRS